MSVQILGWVPGMGNYAQHVDGFVDASDYAALEAERDKIRTMLGQCMRDPEWVGTTCAQAIKDRDELRAALREECLAEHVGFATPKVADVLLRLGDLERDEGGRLKWRE